MTFNINRNRLPLIIFLVVVLLFGAYHLFNSDNPLFISDSKLAQGALPDTIEPETISYIGQYPTTLHIYPGSQLCPVDKGYMYCKLYVLYDGGRSGASMQPLETIAPGNGNAKHYSTNIHLEAVLVGYKPLDATYTRDYLGTSMSTCPTSYSLCKPVAEFTNEIVLPYSMCASGTGMPECGVFDSYFSIILNHFDSVLSGKVMHYYGYKPSNIKCILSSNKCEGNELFKCETFGDGSIDWVSQGVCNDGKSCTSDACINGACRHEIIPNYCGQCETVDDYCNCIPMNCMGYEGKDYSLGQQETRPCGMCGMKTRTCSPTVCGWTDFGDCSNQGVCYPDTSQSCDISGIPGQQVCTQYCNWGTCMQTGECLPNAKRCSGSNAQKCDGTGNWKTTEYCTNGCNSATGDCNICTPTTIRCDGNIRQVCTGDGMNWQFVENCQYGCQDGMCLTCQIGTYRCNGDIKQSCIDGYQWVDYTSCEHGCDNGNCMMCTPDNSICDGNYLKTCTSNGLAWMQQYCQYGCDSVRLECDTLCGPMEKRCYSNTLQRCSTDGMTWSTIQSCPYGCEDSACITPNCGDNPIPYTYSPVYCMASAGETCEYCPEDCGYCPLSLAVQLDPTYITGKPAEVLVAVDGTSQSTVIKGKITLNDEVIHPEISSSTVNGVATLSFNVMQSGKFKLTIWATHPESMQQILVTKNIVFESSLSMRMSYDDMQYLNEPIKAVVTITDSSNRPVGVDTMDVGVTINGRPISCSPDADCWEETGGGEYTISTNIPFSEGEGIIIITVTAGKAGYESITKSASFRVDKPGIQITFSDESPPAYAKKGTSVDVKIYVSSPQDELFDADSVELIVTMPNGQTETLAMSRVTKGTYVTGYKFEQLELHTFKVTVRKTGFETTSKEKNTSVDPGASPIGWIPSLWTIITGILLLGLSYLVYRAVRKKK